MMKKMVLSLLMIPLSMGVAYAQPDNSLREVVIDALYGGLAGALVGVATMAFEDHPSDHAENIQIGAGVGIILGSIYGTMRVSRSFVEVKDKALTVQFPTIQPVRTRSQERWLWTVPLVHLSY